MPFGLQPIHLVVVVLVALVIFGPKRLPQLGRWIGRTFTEFRKGAREMTDGFKEEATRSRRRGRARRKVGDRIPPARPLHIPRRLSATFCTKCGASNPQDAHFCNKCGTQLPV